MSTGLAVAGVRGHTRRLLATALAIVVGVTFVAVSMLMLHTLNAGVRDAAGDGVERHDLVATPGESYLSARDIDALREHDGVEAVTATGDVSGRLNGQWLLAATVPAGTGVEVTAGRLPAGPGEAAVTVTTAELNDVAVGDVLRPTIGERDKEAGPVEVVGIVHPGDHPRYVAMEALLVPEATLREWSPRVEFYEARIDLVAGASEDTVASVHDTIPTALVQTGAEEASYRAEQMTGGVDMLGALLLGFAAVALVTMALVIANTFSIVLAQRSRELALLRCVGATRRQVRRSVFAEAVILGAVASTVGLVLALGLAWTAGRLIGEVSLGSPVSMALRVDAVALLVPWLVGLVVTLVAAWWPTRRATRLAPLAALQPMAAPAARSRAGTLRLGAAALAFAAGGLGLYLGATSRDVLVGVAGGLVSFVGVMLAAVVVVPAAVRLVGAPARAGGVPGNLAVDNAVANPSRAAATSAALLVGVTLITMTTVGAASAARTAEREIAAEYPADVEVRMPTHTDSEGRTSFGRLPQAAQDRLANLGPVTASVPFTGAVLKLRYGADFVAEEEVLGVDPRAAAEVLRESAFATALKPGTIAVSATMMSAYGLREGQRVTVSGPDGTVEATLLQGGLEWSRVVHPDVLAAVDQNAPPVGMLLRLDDGADVEDAMVQVKQAVASTDASVDGAAAVRQELDSILGVLVLVATSLLGVAVVIAVIGIANTLALSVLERGREHALLRGLGLTRGQLRGTLAVEGVLLATVSAVLGILLGIGYAWAGVQSLMPADTTAGLALPIGSLVAVVVLAVAAGLLASVLPARRAARIAPAAVLALP